MKDIYERLKRDHEVQKDLARKLMETSGNSAERQRLFGQFKAETEAHAAAEEQTLYAALFKKPKSQEQARHSVAEHKDAADLIAELTELEMSSGGWIQKFEKLKDELEHHIDEEESDVFDLAKRLIDREAAERLANQFEQRKAAERK